MVVTTRSPLFCDAVLKHAPSTSWGLHNVRRVGQTTAMEPYDATGALFKDSKIVAGLTSGAEEASSRPCCSGAD